MQLHPSRSSTVRETSSTSRRNFLHSRWASEDHTMAESPEGEVDEEGRRIPYRYEARGASAESALVNGARADGVRSRLVDEGLRAAGLTRRKESEDVFTTPPPADPSLRRHQRGATMHDRGWDEIQRRSHSRLEEEPPTYVPGEREPRSPPPPTGTPSLRPRSIQALVGSRPGTSTGIYARGPDDSPRTAVTPLRTHYSSYNLGVAGGTSSPRLPPERSFDSPMRTLLPLPAPGSGGSPMIHGGTEHTRLLLDALSMFESHYSRLNASPDVLRSAQAIVNSASTLNSLLRAGSASALEEQIEADVATSARDADPNANVAEVWKRVGADYRESLRISDDLVRSMTGFMLSIGRTLREGLSSGALTHGRGDDGMSRLSDGTSSRDGGRKSVDGRGSVEGRNADGRRSVEGGRIRSYDGEIHRRNQSVAGMRPDASGPALSAVPSRPSSSMSVLREREREYERQQEREREHEREWDRHRLAQAQESPTPAPAVQSAPPPPVGANTATPSAQPRDRQSIFSSARRYFPSRNSGGESPVSPTEPRRLTRLAIPPPLPTLHSESLVRSKTAPSKSPRKSKPLPSASATLRGSSIMPLGAPSPTTHLTTATVVTSQDTDSPAADAIRRSNTYSFSLSRASGHPATAGATVGEREQRKRTLSTTSATYGEDPIFAPPNGKAPESPRRRLGSKVRMSLDGHSVAENAALGKVE